MRSNFDNSRASLRALRYGVLIAIVGLAQADDWTTIGYDAQRSGWVRTDLKINTTSVTGPEFGLLWKMQLGDQARRMKALSAPMLLDFLIAPKGFRSLAFVGSSSGSVFVMDTDLSRMEWERHLDFSPRPAATADCPGGMTSSLGRPTAAAYPALGGLTARGRRSPGKSAVGQPDQGSVILSEIQPPAPRPPAPKADARVRPQTGRSLRGLAVLSVLTADGMLRTIYVSNGRDHVAPIKFLPPDANARGLIIVDDVAYVATANGCGGAPDGVWALDTESKKVAMWKSSGGAVAGLLGPAVGSDGVVYAATADGALVALEAKTLEQLRTSTSNGFRSSPVIFDHDGKDYVAALSASGKVQLFDGSQLGSPVAESPAVSAGDAPALAAWTDSNGDQWILANGRAKVTAWKVSADGFSPGWTSRNMTSPLAPIVLNGIVFATAGGNARTNAVLHALDGVTGKPLWDSGDSIRSSASGYNLSAGPSHIYLTTDDSSLYSFGIGIEH